jgi:hypothetical protein
VNAESVEEKTTYVEKSSEADEALAVIERHPVIGWDTEFYNCDITRESPVGKSICHVFSVAVPLPTLHPRGYSHTRSWVFSGALLAHPPVKDYFERSSIIKCAHNIAVDDHTLANHGVHLQGGLNTLEFARFVLPGRARGRGFDLDGLGQDLLGEGKSESFDELLGYDDSEPYEAEELRKRCECGALSCRKRTFGHLSRWPERVLVSRTRRVRRHALLADLHEGHPLWARYLAYAARDAVVAFNVYEVLRRLAEEQRPYPWSLL